MPTRPGVYLMRDDTGKPLYVGKARNLRKRVTSYFDARPKIDRIMRMIARIGQIEVSLTRTEGEALLLENEWIKSLKPRYNVLLRDDKSYPWIVITTQHDAPRIAFHRGARDKTMEYFGPYPIGLVGAGKHQPDSETLSHQELRRQLFRPSQQALPAIPDTPLHGALRRTGESG